jgi:hypothetical protein
MYLINIDLPMKKTNLNQLKNALPWGAQLAVSIELHVSPSSVSQVLSGKIENANILQALVKKAQEYQNRLATIEKEMEAL